MTRFEAWLLHLSTLLVGGTGLLYAWLRYGLSPRDPYAVVNSPWQPTVQHLHVLVAPLLVFAVGVVWRRHVWSHLTGGIATRRRSGWSLLVAALPMVTSGYLLQTAVEESWRHAWIAVHLGASALWLAGYLAHQLSRRSVRSRQGRRRGGGAARAAAE